MRKIKILYVVNYFDYSGPCNVLINIVRNINQTKFEVRLITIFPEAQRSQIKEFVKYGEHLYIPLKRWDVLFGNVKALKKEIDRYQPDVIHATCVFAEYAVKCIDPGKEFITLHSFMKEDYIMGKGKVIGSVLCWMEKQVIRNAAMVVACGENLCRKYQREMKISVGYIRNGVDTEHGEVRHDKARLREKLGLPPDKRIFVYSANFNLIKNHRFLLENIDKVKRDDLCFLFLGDGPTLQELKNTYDYGNVIYQGRVSNVQDFLRASDVYISVSRSEGMPMAVLEALAAGLPVLLSNIPQHMELFQLENGIGQSYVADDAEDLVLKIESMCRCNLKEMGTFSEKLVKDFFSAKAMSREYQKKYLEIAGAIKDEEDSICDS